MYDVVVFSWISTKYFSGQFLWKNIERQQQQWRMGKSIFGILPYSSATFSSFLCPRVARVWGFLFLRWSSNLLRIKISLSIDNWLSPCSTFLFCRGQFSYYSIFPFVRVVVLCLGDLVDELGYEKIRDFNVRSSVAFLHEPKNENVNFFLAKTNQIKKIKAEKISETSRSDLVMFWWFDVSHIWTIFHFFSVSSVSSEPSRE